MTKQAFLFLHLQLHNLRTRDSACESLFRLFVVVYNSLPMHAALVRAVLHVRALLEKMRGRVDLQTNILAIMSSILFVSFPR